MSKVRGNTMNLFSSKQGLYADLLLRDVSSFSSTFIEIGGAQNKSVLTEGGKTYIIKFNPKGTNDFDIPYHLSEHLSCTISNMLGYSAQKTELVIYKGLECVMIEMFDDILRTFIDFGNSTLEGNNLTYDLDCLFELLKETKFSCDLNTFIFDTFLIDSFLFNADRHPNNWGFFCKDALYTPAPLIDFGNSLFSHKASKLNINSSCGSTILKSKSNIKYKNKTYTFTTLLNKLLIENNPQFRSSLLKFNTRLELVDFEFIHSYKQDNYVYNNYLDFVYKLLNFNREKYLSIGREVL